MTSTLAQVIDLHFSRQDWMYFFLIIAGLLLAITIYYRS